MDQTWTGLYTRTYFHLALGGTLSVLLFGYWSVPVGMPVLLMVFAAVLAVYNGITLAKYHLGKFDSDPERHSFVLQHLFFIRFLVITSIGILVFFALQIPPQTLLLCICPAVIALLYAIPFIPFRGKLLAPRELPYSKALLVAVVWTFATTVFPQHATGRFAPTAWTWWFITGRFLFFYILATAADLRDMELDAPHMKTLPRVMQKERLTWLLSFTAVIICAIDLLIFLSGHMPAEVLASLLITHAALLVLLSRTKHAQPAHFYYLLMDGLLLLQGLLYFLFSVAL